MPRSSKCSLSLRFLHHNPICISPLPHYKPYAPSISFLIWTPEYLVSSHHSAPHCAISNMSSHLLIYFMCTISLGISSLFLVFLTFFQIHHFLNFQRYHTMGLQHILLSLYAFLITKISILEGLFNFRNVMGFAYLLFLKAYACINGTKMWKNCYFLRNM